MQSAPLQIKITNNWLFVVVALFCVIMGFIYPSIQASTSSVYSRVTGIEYIVDDHSQFTLDSIIKQRGQVWQSDSQGNYSFGMAASPHWFKLTLPQIDVQRTWLLEVGYPLLDNVSVWFEDNGLVLAEYHSGDRLPFNQRPIKNERFIFPVPQAKQLITVYIRVETTGALRMSVDVWPQASYLSFASEYNIVMGLFFGFMLAMGISSLFNFATTKLGVFAAYSGYVFFLALSLAALHGLGYKHLWPNSPWFQQHALPIFANLTVAFSIIFCDLLLDVKRYSLKLSRLLRLLALLYFLSVLLSLFVPLPLLNSGFLFMLLASGALIYGVGIWLWTKGVSLAGVYTLAWSVLFFAGFIICLDNLNIAKFDLPSDYLMVLGAAIETLLLALVLAINNNQQRLALQQTQDELLAKTIEEKQTQESMLALQENTQEELEYKVQERTLELEIALRELSEINRELQEKNTLDALTGVRNRSYFDKKYIAETRRSRRERTQLSIVMLDIDHFKSVNDKYGHLAGDECIIAVARMLKGALKRPSDDLCRYGGEEFVLILPSTELAGATALVEQVREKIEKQIIQFDGHNISLTISAGIATAIVNPQDAEDTLLAAADQQLYSAKKAGRNNVKGIFLDANDEYL
ncbi:MAG: diguanylate cyclase [Paraglaciecola sp.]|uniref:sensor domain-containing diguanylate cyclase n=1 Tax=Paraglaciecola sp. TaxID=1920173 RepID=UPI00273F4C1A|nr:diguanylate cyclase [Paraglaciecola sp.]MDP5029896.1 diguanylate cyclase [Paraglaciecola sp.]MDP5134002.1 diguanylate cyclase [Paraglaciecola sp.]